VNEVRNILSREDLSVWRIPHYGRSAWLDCSLEVDQGPPCRAVHCADQLPSVRSVESLLTYPHRPWETSDDFLLLPGDGLILISAQGTILFFDHQARLQNNALGGQALGQPVDELWPELAAALEHHSVSVKQQGPLDTRVDLNDQARLVRLFSTDNGMGVAILGDRTSIHALASQQLLMHRSILEQLRDTVIVTTAEPIATPGPVIVYANPAALKQTGYRLTEVLGRSPRMFQGPRTDPAALRTFREALMHWQPVRQVVLNYRKNGSTFWVEIDLSPLCDHDGWHSFWVSVQRECREPQRQSRSHHPSGSL